MLWWSHFLFLRFEIVCSFVFGNEKKCILICIWQRIWLNWCRIAKASKGIIQSPLCVWSAICFVVWVNQKKYERIPQLHIASLFSKRIRRGMECCPLRRCLSLSISAHNIFAIFRVGFWFVYLLLIIFNKD